MTKKKTILHITSSLKIGGAEQVLYALIAHLKRESVNQKVIYFHEGPFVQKIKDLGIATYQVKGLVSLYDPVFFLRLYRLIKKIKPDCIHSVLWSANICSRVIGKLLSVPVFCALHNNIDQNGVVRNLFDFFTINWTESYIAVSDEVCQTVNEYHTIQRPIKIIKNGIDVNQVKKMAYESPEQRKIYSIGKQDFVIGSVGRFEAVKDYSFLINSFSKLIEKDPQFHLMLIGYGSQEKLLRELVFSLKLKDKVAFLIQKPAYCFYPLFDCFVQTSEKEGISMALLEAMSLKICPIVYSPKKHCLVENNNSGIVIPQKTPQAFCEAFISLKSEPNRRKQLGFTAYEEVRNNWSLKKMVALYKNILIG